MDVCARRFHSNILRDRFSVYVVPHIETCLDCFQGKRLSFSTRTRRLHVCFFLLCLIILKTISPVPCIVETIFLVYLFLKAERKMWVFVGLRFPIQYPLRQVRIVSQDRISGKRPKYFCQILEFAQMIHFLK